MKPVRRARTLVGHAVAFSAVALGTIAVKIYPFDPSEVSA